ncbi:MAG: 50S ribosomal protein L1 [Candidatus Thermoplasmatota archaeon]|nr:50S ribosomal protein L1 [Candidatus Thermoplasmatota archaeon]
MAEETNIEKIKKALESAPKRGFLESVEIAINLKDVDLKQPKNRIQEQIILPKGRGKPMKVVVFGSGEFALKAKEVADLVIQPEEIDDLVKNKRSTKRMVNEHDFFIAETPLMPVIGKRMGIILGPRGKMPQPLPPQADPAPIIASLRNKIRIRSKDRRTFHAAIGTIEMSVADLTANYEEVIKRVQAHLDRGLMNIDSVYVKTTMGPSTRMM